MEYIVEKLGMSRTVSVPSVSVTLLKVQETKVCEVFEGGKAIVAYSLGKKMNKTIVGQQKKYGLTPEFNRFATLSVEGSQPGDMDLAPLGKAAMIKATFKSKGRGYSGVIKRWNFSGGPKSHGSRFHRRAGSIGNCEWPGRVMPGHKMAGRYGNTNVTVKNEIVSFDAENMILAVKGSIPGPDGAIGRIRIGK